MNNASGTAWVVEHRAVVSSTMDVAAELARAGARDRTVVVADEQTAGRGRAGRSWHAQMGTSLLMTAILRPQLHAQAAGGMSIAVGLAVADAISDVCGITPWLKWPNDLWIGSQEDGEKVAGVLIQNRVVGDQVEVALVGIGVNIDTHAEEIGGGATHLHAHADAVTRDALLAAVLRRIDERVPTLVANGGRLAVDEWNVRAALLGHVVQVEDGDRAVTGTLTGLGEDGSLLLRSEAGEIVALQVGDLTRGPRKRG